MTLGITDCSSYENYHRWLAQEQGLEIIRLSHKAGNFDAIHRCNGVVLSGGEDVHPKYYNKIEYLEFCEEVDDDRDSFEWKVLDYVEQNQLPVLGICRGLQITNVYFGGNLVPHLPAFGKFNHSEMAGKDRYHTIQVDPNSLMHRIVGADTGEVNSAHHQAPDRIGKGLVANTLSPDGVVEGLERPPEAGRELLLLVQWHPERMRDQHSAFSKNIRTEFLRAVARKAV